MKIQKRHIVTAALVLALGTAVYINWQFADSAETESAKELGAASYVSATVSNTSTADESAASGSSLTSEQEEYFASERTKRRETQDEIIDEAEEILELESSSDGEKSEAEQDIARMLEYFTTQDSIETIIRAKGFSDCLCVISDMGVTVIVPSNELDDSAALAVYDAVTLHYEVDYDKISIIGA